ncbi:MAG TPA: hypothetical protein VGO86_19280 [Candidatus Dormibacteraeota bacterium]
MGAVGTLAVVLMACGQNSGSAELARMLRLGYRAAAIHHFRYHSSITGDERSADGGQRQDNADTTADAAWRVVSVDAGGRATIDQTLSGVQPAVQGATGAWRFTVEPDGLVTPGVASRAMVPGTTQFLAILPQRPVRPGDGWTSDLSLPGPFGAAPTTLGAQSRFERYTGWRGVRVAVVSSRMTGPFDVTVTAGRRQMRYRGTVDSRSTTWLDPGTGRAVKVDSTVVSDFTAAASDDPKSVVRFTGTYRLGLESEDRPAPQPEP